MLRGAIDILGFTFHYFQNEIHVPCQGSLTAQQLAWILRRLRESFTLVSPQQFLEDVRRRKEDPAELCLCFDCGLKSQYDIALPVLEEFGLKAFWFLYTSVLDGGIVTVEQVHHFRFSCFASVDRFYSVFFQAAADRLSDRFDSALSAFRRSGYLNWAPFYTEEDRLFKYLRDRVMTEEEFHAVLQRMMREAGYEVEAYRDLLWLSRDEVRHLSDTGHVIGMHTHTHPNEIGKLPYEAQLREYGTCQKILREITGQPVVSMSHPCNSYSGDTLRVLRELGVEAGFRADQDPRYRSALELPRIDHAAWIRQQKESVLWQ